MTTRRQEQWPALDARTRRYLVGLARGFAGAVLFAIPLFMTMEMWTLAATMAPPRLALLLLLTLPLLIGLSHFVGFERTFSWRDDALDALAAWAVGAVAAAGSLAVFGLLGAELSLYERASRVILQTVPASLGALLAQSQLGSDRLQPSQEGAPGYGAALFAMTVGALFLAFNIAPTEEIVLIAGGMSPYHTLALMLVSLVLMQAFVYHVEFRGSRRHVERAVSRASFVRHSLAGYGVALLVSAYLLWTFGRTDGVTAASLVQRTVVLGLPAAVGAAAARLIL